MKMTIPEFLQKEMDARGMSQADLARASGKTTGTISNLINHPEIRPTPDTLRAIAKALRISPDVILTVAGYIHNIASTSSEIQQLVFMFDQLNDKSKRQVLDIVQVIFDSQQKEE